MNLHGKINFCDYVCAPAYVCMNSYYSQERNSLFRVTRLNQIICKFILIMPKEKGTCIERAQLRKQGLMGRIYRKT